MNLNNKIKSQRKSKKQPTWVKVSIAILLFVIVVIVVTVCAELSGIIILRKTEDMVGSENAISVLWVGNSDVFVGELPGQLKNVARPHDVEIVYKDISRHSNRGGGISGLKESAINEMQSGRFDYIVLMDDPWQTRDNTGEFLSDVRLLCEEARMHGTIPVLFNAMWAATGNRPDEARLSTTIEAYKQAANENDTILVNAADAWIYAYQTIPEVALINRFDPRGPHPSKAGGFYTACLFAAKLFDLQIEDIPKDSRYKGNDAIDLAKAAWEFVQLSR